MQPEFVPLFPLPGVVLFPQAVLPLHIFEQRYKAMIADALAGNRVIAMALLVPGWERSYYDQPAIEPVVCVGRILTHEKLCDGKYNLLLQGRRRARIVREVGKGSYRMAEVQTITVPCLPECELQSRRRRLFDIVSRNPWAEMPWSRQLRQILRSDLPTPDAADLIAFNVLDDAPLKQSLLAEPDSILRIDRLIEAMQSIQPPAVTLDALNADQPYLN